MTITTDEAERLAEWCSVGLPVIATALRSLAAERDALKADLLAARNGAVTASDLVATARRDALEEAAQRAAHYERMAYQHGHLPVDDPHECAAQVAREIEASIRALKGEGDE